MKVEALSFLVCEVHWPAESPSDASLLGLFVEMFAFTNSMWATFLMSPLARIC
jgi:hypothetical protein